MTACRPVATTQFHLAAMSTRVWDEPLEWPTFEGSGQPVTNEEISRAVAENADLG